MAERTILASFYSREEATTAANQIKDLGVDVAAVDELHAYSGIVPEKRTYTISGDIQSLASLSLNVLPISRDASVLLGADPAASGMSDGRDNVTGRNYLLTVVCPEQQVQTAVNIIRKHRGYT